MRRLVAPLDDGEMLRLMVGGPPVDLGPKMVRAGGLGGLAAG